MCIQSEVLTCYFSQACLEYDSSSFQGRHLVVMWGVHRPQVSTVGSACVKGLREADMLALPSSCGPSGLPLLRSRHSSSK